MPVETQKLFSLWDSIKLDNFDDIGEIGVNSSGTSGRFVERTIQSLGTKQDFQLLLRIQIYFEILISGVIQKYGKKLKWFGQEQSSFELENEGRLLPIENADLIGRVFHGFQK